MSLQENLKNSRGMHLRLHLHPFQRKSIIFSFFKDYCKNHFMQDHRLLQLTPRNDKVKF